MPSLNEIESLAERLLGLTTQPAPRYRILRDGLGLAPQDSRLAETRLCLLDCPAAAELRAACLPGGGWGRFHSRDSSLHLKFPTTEFAIKRALALGLDASSDILGGVIPFMEAVLAAGAGWSDPPEKHEGWPVNVRFITAGVLASIDPCHPALVEFSRVWVELVRRTFRSGQYSPEEERRAHLELNGIRTRGKYLKLAGLYPLRLLSSPSSGLDPDLEKVLLEWVWKKDSGIYYVYGEPLEEMPPISSPHFIFWLEAQELLAHFGTWKLLAQPILQRLWSRRDPQSLWDFGPAARASVSFPLSDSWKNPIDRKIDCSVRVLALLRKAV